MSAFQSSTVVAALFAGAALVAQTSSASAQVIDNVQAPPAPAAASVAQPVVVAQPVAVAQPVVMDMRPYGHRLMVSGATTFGVVYLSTVLAGGIAGDVCNSQGALGCRDSTWPLFIPVFGPFVQMGYINGAGAGTGRALLAIDGIAQGVGVGLFIAGAVMATSARPAAAVVASRRIRVEPFSTASGHGIMTVGSF